MGHFFEYLRVQSIISNKGFFEEIMANGRTENSYIGRMMKYIQELENLTPKEALQILDENNVAELPEWFDKQFEVLENWDLPVNFKRAGTVIWLKLMLMYGIT